MSQQENPVSRETKNKESDEALCRLAGLGDEEAAEILIRRYKGMALRKSRAYFLAGADKEDALQECMIGIFEAIRSYQPDRGAGFATFVSLCMDRSMISAVRSATKQKNRALNESVSLDGPIPGQSENDENPKTLMEVLEDSETAPENSDGEWIQELERQLTGGRKPVLSPFEQEVWKEFRTGKQYREIATKLGKSPKSVDNAIQRIRRKIREMLGR